MSSAAYTPLPTSVDVYPPPTAAGHLPWRARRRWPRAFLPDIAAAWRFYGAAILTGLSLYLLGSYIFRTPTDPIPLSSFNRSIIASIAPRPGACIDSGSYLRTNLGQLVSTGETRDLDHLREMVSRTKGYYTRDYSVWLGWNNVRFACLRTAELPYKYLIPTTCVDALYHRGSITTRTSPTENPRRPQLCLRSSLRVG